MATATPPSTPQRWEQDHKRIRHPLDRLRKYINSYVSLEAAALIGLLVALAFWVGLTLDYGLFATARLDWVQVLPWWLRASVLSIFVLFALVVLLFLVFTRLFKQFRDGALAAQPNIKPDPVADFYQGGPFCRDEYEGDFPRP